jgi:RNA polymerase sigma-70 factor (ECF subfamily)
MEQLDGRSRISGDFREGGRRPERLSRYKEVITRDSAESSSMKSELAVELERQRPRMYRVALRIVGRHEEANEVVQIASLKSWQRIDRFEGRSSLASWLFRITFNAACDQLRKAKRAPASLNYVAQKNLESANANSQLKDIENRELYLMTLQRVEQLPDDCRETFILSQLDGYSYQQIAEIQDVPEGTVASRIHRAKQILCQQLREYC